MIQTPPEKAIRTHAPAWLDVAKMLPAAANGRVCRAAPPHPTTTVQEGGSHFPGPSTGAVMTESVSMPLAPTLPFLSVLREWAWVGPSRKGIHTSKKQFWVEGYILPA